MGFSPRPNFSVKNKTDNNILFAKNYFKKHINDLNKGIKLQALAMGPLH